jgi:hypothetical protein
MSNTSLIYLAHAAPFFPVSRPFDRKNLAASDELTPLLLSRTVGGRFVCTKGLLAPGDAPLIEYLAPTFQLVEEVQVRHLCRGWLDKYLAPCPI